MAVTFNRRSLHFYVLKRLPLGVCGEDPEDPPDIWWTGACTQTTQRKKKKTVLLCPI